MVSHCLRSIDEFASIRLDIATDRPCPRRYRARPRRHPRRGPGDRPRGSTRSGPGAGRWTEPATTGCSPAGGQGPRSAAGASAGETTTQKAGAHVESGVHGRGRDGRPADAIRAKISGGRAAACPGCTTRPRPSRARLSRPPPEMCASPRGGDPGRPQRLGGPHVHPGRREQRVGQPGSAARRGPGRGQRIAIAVAGRKLGQGQDDGRPGGPRTRPPGCAPSGIAPTAVPTRSSMGPPPAESASIRADLGDLAAGDGDAGLVGAPGTGRGRSPRAPPRRSGRSRCSRAGPAAPPPVQITSLTLLATQSIPTGSHRSASRARQDLGADPVGRQTRSAARGGTCISVAK